MKIAGDYYPCQHPVAFHFDTVPAKSTMNLFILFLLGLAFAATEIHQDRLSTMEALRQAMASFKEAQDDAMLHVAEAKSQASTILASFYDTVIEQQMNFVQQVSQREEETLQYGEQVADPWCWEHNIPLLQGIMSWLGTDFSECVKQLEKRAAEAVGTIFRLFEVDDEEVTQYSLLKVFQRRNIVTNPKSVVDAIAGIIMNVTAVSGLEINREVTEFEVALNASISPYSECLEGRLKERMQLIQVLKDQTTRCMEDQKE